MKIIRCSSSRSATSKMIRCKSSNVWGYSYEPGNDGFGTMYIQFKDANGRAGDVYAYYDVPSKVYQRWVGTGSKGHFFWQFIRNQFQYAKLTGDKKGVLPNAVVRR